MQIIPSVDLLDGKVVRLHQGRYAEATVYHEHAETQLSVYAEAGFSRIHVVDLNGARDGHPVHLHVIEKLAARYRVSFQYGGGIRTAADVARVLSGGAAYAVATSMAVKNPDSWAAAVQQFGASHFISGLDLKDGKVAYSGWTETAEGDTGAFIRTQLELGVRTFLCTDVSRDGTLKGPNTALYAALSAEYPEAHWIASGGFSGPQDLEPLRQAGCAFVVIGKAFYENRISLDEMRRFNGLA